jgi:hypothetical protein
MITAARSSRHGRCPRSPRVAAIVVGSCDRRGRAGLAATKALSLVVSYDPSPRETEPTTHPNQANNHTRPSHDPISTSVRTWWAAQQADLCVSHRLSTEQVTCPISVSSFSTPRTAASILVAKRYMSWYLCNLKLYMEFRHEHGQVFCGEAWQQVSSPKEGGRWHLPPDTEGWRRLSPPDTEGWRQLSPSVRLAVHSPCYGDSIIDCLFLTSCGRVRSGRT